ncbi:hypothetical protein BHM03_00027900 [Ensete ventricosum]|nr:hypothetical protein BHM03_00027900 [Ensete ventricosum]
MSNSDPSLHNAANSNHSLPSSLIAANSDPLWQKATSSDLSLQSVYIAARSNISLPTVLIVANNELNMTNNSLFLYTIIALLRNNCALHCPVFPILFAHQIKITVDPPGMNLKGMKQMFTSQAPCPKPSPLRATPTT